MNLRRGKVDSNSYAKKIEIIILNLKFMRNAPTIIIMPKSRTKKTGLKRYNKIIEED